jgi:NhaP-type Na+/H+ or K+/H+ antiporter
MLLCILFAKFFFEAYFEKLKPRFGHNTGVVVLIGMLVSFLIYTSVEDKTVLTELEFNEKVFFFIVLPSIMFPSGYNMRRKKFFANIVHILKFGLVGTLICFALYSVALNALHESGLLVKWDPKINEYVELDLNMY